MSDLPPVLIDPAPQPKEEQIETCPLCGSEMIKNKEGRMQCPSEHLHKKNPKNKALYKEHNYIGQIREHVKSTITMKGEIVDSSTIKCEKCEGKVDLNYVIDLEGGVALAKIIIQMSELGKLRRQWRKLLDKRPRMNFYAYEVEKEILFAKFMKLEADGLFSSYSVEIGVVCPHCFVPQGQVKVQLEVTVPLAEGKAHSWDELYQSAENIPKEIAAKVAHELGYQSFGSLKKWAGSADLSKLAELAAEFKSKFDALDAPDSIGYEFSKQLNLFLNDLPKEARRRKQLVVEKVQELAKLEAARR